MLFRCICQSCVGSFSLSCQPNLCGCCRPCCAHSRIVPHGPRDDRCREGHNRIECYAHTYADVSGGSARCHRRRELLRKSESKSAGPNAASNVMCLCLVAQSDPQLHHNSFWHATTVTSRRIAQLPGFMPPICGAFVLPRRKGADRWLKRALQAAVDKTFECRRLLLQGRSRGFGGKGILRRARKCIDRRWRICDERCQRWFTGHLAKPALTVLRILNPEGLHNTSTSQTQYICYRSHEPLLLVAVNSKWGSESNQQSEPITANNSRAAAEPTV